MPSSKYLDCELSLTNYNQAELSVAGQQYPGQPALDEELRRQLRQAKLEPIRYGTALFEALFPRDRTGGDLLTGYHRALGDARSQGKHLRFRLRIATTAPADLHELQWEFLYDASEKIHLARSRQVAFSRYLSVGLEPPGTVAEKLRLLVVLSCPRNLADFNLPALDRREMRQSIAKALSVLEDQVSCQFLEGPATAGRICDRLVSGSFHALLLQGHGVLPRDRPTASLVLEGQDERAKFVDEELFSEIFEGERELRLVILLACHSGSKTTADPFSGLGPALVARGIPAVVAMQQPVSTAAAGLFTEYFFRNLRRSGHVDRAVNLARRQLHLAAVDDLEWATPALFMRLPDGLLWQSPPTPGAGPSSSLASTEAELWDGLLPWIEFDKLIPILGPGVNRELLPIEDIATEWATKYRYPLNGRPSLPRVAQYVEAKLGMHIPHYNLTKALAEVHYRCFERDENEAHQILAELPISNYVTTNYDGFMTAALRCQGRKPQRRACTWKTELSDPAAIAEYDRIEGTHEEPLVFHLYGNTLESTSQVLTEDDHLDFLGAVARNFNAEPSIIPSALRAGLSEASLLFLGYNTDDLDCRVLFRGLVAQLKRPPQRKRLAVLQLDGAQDDQEKRREVQFFIQKSCENLWIQVYWGSVRQFLTELRRQWESQYGDL